MESQGVEELRFDSLRLVRPLDVGHARVRALRRRALRRRLELFGAKGGGGAAQERVSRAEGEGSKPRDRRREVGGKNKRTTKNADRNSINTGN